MELLQARARDGRRASIAWIKAHANMAAALRVQLNGAETITAAGIREAITTVRKKHRALAGFGKGQRCQGKWSRKAVTGYTQLRTNAGPFRAFLASEKAGRKIGSPDCRRCRARVPETGEHIVFECQEACRRDLRRRLIRGARGWEDLDKPRRKPREGVGGPEGGGYAQEDKEDLVVTFFESILCHEAQDDDDEEVEEVEGVEAAVEAAEVERAHG